MKKRTQQVYIPPGWDELAETIKSTQDAKSFLELDNKPENNKAANLFWVAVKVIQDLKKEIENANKNP
jgi:hypothetical protein